MKKLLVVLLVIPIVFLSGCWSSNEVNTLAITLCTGIDKTENGYLITEQVINPKAIASKKATNESPVFLFTEEGSNLKEAIQKFATHTSRKIYNMHLRMVVLGGEVAKDGIKDILDYFTRNYEYRTDFYFVVARNTTAREVLSVLTPLETIPGIDLYNSLKLSSEELATTKSVRIVELTNSIIADGINPVLTGIKITKGTNISDSTEALKQSYGIKEAVYSGIGAFKKDKLVGWLDEEECKGYNYITGNIKSSVGYVNYDKEKIIIKVVNSKAVMKTSIVNGKPVIDAEIKVNQNVASVEGEFDVTKEENIKILNKLAEEKIKSYCDKAINKTQNEFKTDIFGFGEAVHRKYPKIWNKIKRDWNNEFSSLPVHITVNVETKQLGQITKSFFTKEKE